MRAPINSLLRSGVLLTALAAAFPFCASTIGPVRLSWSHPPIGVSVAAKQSLELRVDHPATWSLQPGSVGTLKADGNVLTYSAPSVKAQNSVAGCQVLPADSVYSTPVDKLPVHEKSAAWIEQSMKVAPVAVAFGEAWGHNIVDNSLPPTRMTFYYTKLRDGAMYQILSGSNRNRETGALTTDGGNDHHMITVNRQTCRFYETYHDYTTGLSPEAPYKANSGYDYTSASYEQPKGQEGGGSTDAAGLPLMPLTVHLSEWEAGKIDHALRFTSCAGCISSPALWPAVGSTAATPGAAPMGSRWRLKSSFKISSFSPKAKVILTALQQYGMILADVGGLQQVQVDDDINLDPELNAALGEIQRGHIVQSNFDIVDESSFMVSTASSRVNPENGFVKPPNFVQIDGVDAKGKKVLIPVTVQPILVGTPHEVLYVQAGTSYQIPSWVNNNTDQQVTWSLVSGPGSINASGRFTPPASIAKPTPFDVTATAAADNSATATVRGFVLPAGPIRIDVGNPNPYTDAHGNEWMADTLGVYTGSYMNDNRTYPGRRWKNIPDWFLYGWNKYTWGDDIVYGPFVVPDGTYQVKFLFAKGDCDAKFDPTFKFDNGLVSGGTLALEANGNVTPFNFAKTVNFSCLTPGIGTVSATVKDNLLTVAVRATGADGAHQAPFLSALAILPK